MTGSIETLYFTSYTLFRTTAGLLHTKCNHLPHLLTFRSLCELYSWASAQLMSCLGLFHIVPTFLFISLTTILPLFLCLLFHLSFTLAVPMCEVASVGHAPRAWDPCSLQAILDGILYFEEKLFNCRSVPVHFLICSLYMNN